MSHVGTFRFLRLLFVPVPVRSATLLVATLLHSGVPLWAILSGVVPHRAGGSSSSSRSFWGSRVPSWSGLVSIRLYAPRLASTHVSLAVTCSSLRGVAPSSRFAGTHVWPGFRLGCWLVAVRSYVSLALALLLGAGLWASRFLTSLGVAGCWASRFFSPTSRQWWAHFGGWLHGVSGCCLFGSHIRWWSHFWGSHFAGGQGAIRWLRAGLLFRLAGRASGLLAATRHSGWSAGTFVRLAYGQVPGWGGRLQGLPASAVVRLAQVGWLHPVGCYWLWASLASVRYGYPCWASLLQAGCWAPVASGGYCSPWGHVTRGRHLGVGYCSTRIGALAVQRPGGVGCTSVAGSAPHSYAPGGS